MASGQPGAAAKVAASLAALPFPLWSGDPRPSHGWDGDPRAGHNGPPPLAALRFAGPVSASRDFPVARSRTAVARPQVPFVVLWASGRLTMTTAGAADSVIQQDIVPPFLSDHPAEATPQAATPAQVQSAAAHVALGQKLQQQGQLSDGIPEFRKAIQLDPNNANAQFWLANTLYHVNDVRKKTETDLRTPPPAVLDEAILHLRKAVALQPANTEWLSALGTYLSDRGRDAEAVPCYKKALHLLGLGPVGAWNPLHSTSLDKGSGEAHEIFDNQWLLGDSLLKTHQFEEAALHYQAALEFNPKATWVLLGYGDALNEAGKRTEAHLAWKKAMALEPPPFYYGAQARQRLSQYPY